MSFHVSSRCLCLAIVALGASAQSGCGPQQRGSEAQQTEPSTPARAPLNPTVAAYFEAVRESDLQSVGRLLHPEFQSIQVSPLGNDVEAANRQDMINNLFAAFEWPGLRYETVDWMAAGDLVSVSVLEIATHPPEPVEPAGPFFMVFEVEPEGIRRIWSLTTPPPDAPR